MQTKTIAENVENVKELIQVNKILLTQLSTILFKLKSKVNKDDINTLPELGFDYVPNEFNVLNDFLDNSEIKIKFYYKDNNKGGSFINARKLIILFLDDKFFEEFNNITDIDKNDIELLLNKHIKLTLLHELQHAFDNFRSKGKAFLTKQQQDYQKLLSKKFDNWIDKNKKWNSYINLETEIWARVTETIPQLSFYDFDNNQTKTLKPIQDILKQFKSNFRYWNDLNENKKKRLIKFILNFYYSL